MTQTKLITNTANLLEIKGELTFDTVKMLWNKSKKIFFTNNPYITIDLANVTHSDSAGLALLIEWQKIATEHHKIVDFINLPKQLINIAKISKLENILKIEEQQHEK